MARLFVGVVAQDCTGARGPCNTGVLNDPDQRTGPAIEVALPDPDLAAQFCASPIGQTVCGRGQVRLLRLEEEDISLKNKRAPPPSEYP